MSNPIRLQALDLMPRIATRPSQPPSTQNHESLINDEDDDASKGENVPILINKILKVNEPDKFYGNKRKLKLFLI